MKMKNTMAFILLTVVSQGCSVLSAVGTVALDTLECAAGVDCVASHQEDRMTHQQREAARRQAQVISQSLRTNNGYIGSNNSSSVKSCKVNPYGEDGKLRCGCGGTCAQ